MPDEPDAPTERDPSDRIPSDVLPLLDRLVVQAERGGLTEAVAVLRTLRRAVARPGGRIAPR